MNLEPTTLTKKTWDAVSKAAREYFLTNDDMVLRYLYEEPEPVCPIYLEDPLKTRIAIENASGYGGYYLDEGCVVHTEKELFSCITDESMFGYFEKRGFTTQETKKLGTLCPYLLCLRTDPDLPEKVKGLNFTLTERIVRSFYEPFYMNLPMKTEVSVDLDWATMASSSVSLKPEENIQVRVSLLTKEKESGSLVSFEVVRKRMVCFGVIPWTTRFRTNDYTEALMYISEFLE